MNEEETMSVETPLQEAQEVAPPTESEQRPVTAEEARKRNDAEYNWAETRRKLQEQERQIRERDAYIAQLKNQHQPEPEEEISLAEDDLPTYGHVKKAWKKQEQKLKEELRQEIKTELAQSTLKLRFPDFDEIVTQENIEILNQQAPELALSLRDTKDPYIQSVSVYRALKMIGVSGSNKPSPSLANEKEKAIKNAQKPLSVNAVAKQSALGEAYKFENGLTPELKSQLYREMQECIKRS